MSSYTFKSPSGETFSIKVPAGTSFDQAKEIFNQQVETGGLVGFKIGDALNAASQLANGLTAAQAQVGQALASAAGALPKGTNLESLTASLGTGGAGAANQVSRALSGSIPSVSSLTTGASAAVNAAISGLNTGSVTGVGGAIPALTAVAGPLTGVVAQAGSLANNAIKTIAGSISGTPLQGINVADYAKQGPSLGPIQGLSASAVTGTLAQVSKLVGQTASTISNTLGLGKFGLDSNQLERSGYLKPGTTATFITADSANLTSVLSSPLSWTGKDGIKSADDLLGNDNLQNKIQQNLMSKGLTDLKQIGIPTDILSPSALAGVSSIAAKSVDLASNFLKNTGLVPPDIKVELDDTMVNTAFAVNLSEDKIEPELKQEEVGPSDINTVDTDTVNAAGERIVGNAKVPSLAELAKLTRRRGNGTMPTDAGSETAPAEATQDTVQEA